MSSSYNETLGRIVAKWGVDLTQKSPIEIPGVGRRDLMRLASEAGFLNVVEVGVEQGEFAEVICREIPGVFYVGVDAWAHYSGYRDHVSNEKLQGFYERTHERLAPYDAALVRAFSVDASKLFEDGYLDLVYIDANHSYASVLEDIEAWSPKVREGGIVAGHDYVRRKSKSRDGYVCQVVEATNDWTKKHGIEPWFVLGSKDVRAEDERGQVRSWMWVKR